MEWGALLGAGAGPHFVTGVNSEVSVFTSSSFISRRPTKKKMKHIMVIPVWLICRDITAAEPRSFGESCFDWSFTYTVVVVDLGVLMGDTIGYHKQSVSE